MTSLTLHRALLSDQASNAQEVYGQKISILNDIPVKELINI